MKRLIASTILIIALIIPSISFSLPLVDIELAAGGWLNSPGGFAGYNGDDLNLEDDLDYSDETSLMGRMRVELPFLLPNFTVMTTSLSYKGDGKLAHTFDFGDTDFTANADFHSELKLDHQDVALSFSLPLLNLATLGKLQADLGVNLRLLDLEAKIEQGNIKESKSITLPIPMGFAYLRLEPVDGIAIEAEGRGLVIGDNSMKSFIGRLRYNIIGPLFIAGGYRLESIDIDEEGIRIDTEFRGPFAEAGFKF